MERLSAQEVLQLYDQRLQNAQIIQQRIIPKTDTFDSSCYSFYSYLKPFRRVGGDFYDFKVFDDDSVSLILADAVGHGIDAAMITSMIKLIYSYSLRILDNQKSPSKLMAEIDTEIEETLGFSFFSVFSVCFNPNKNELYWSNAGHPPGIIISKDEGIISLNASLPLIGMHSMVNNSGYVDHVNNFKPGDKFLLFTDGLIEAKNDKGEPYTFQRLLNLIEDYKDSSIEVLCRLIINDNKEFSASTEANDDICLLGIEYDS